MPKVTHIFKTFFPDTEGGLEEAIRQIGKHSINNNFDVSVDTISKKPKQTVIDGIRVNSYKFSFGSRSAPFSISFIRSYRKIVKKSDIIHLHFPSMVGEIVAAFTKKRKPLVITYHCGIYIMPLILFFFKPIIHIAFKKADIIVPTSDNLILSNNILQPYRNKTEVIPLWLDETRFQNLNEPNKDIIKIVNRYKTYCLFVGVLRWYKGLDILLDASKHLDEYIFIVGRGPLESELKYRITNENIQNVKLLGYQSDNNIKFLFENTRFTVLPSISPAEAFGQVLLESSYFSKAMISTELGTGTSFVNVHNKTGLVVKPNDKDELSRGMKQLFGSPSLCEKYGQNAKIRLENSFSESSQAKKYLNIYNRLLLQKSANQ